MWGKVHPALLWAFDLALALLIVDLVATLWAGTARAVGRPHDASPDHLDCRPGNPASHRRGAAGAIWSRP
jgi:hypothetical protein